MRVSKGKRLLSLLLAVMLVVPTVLNAVPGIVQEVSAASVDTGTLSAGSAGQLVNGVYEIYFPGTSLGITPVDNGYDYGTVMELTTIQHWYSQRWIIEYGGTYDLTEASGDEGHYYTIRSIYNGRLLGQNSTNQPHFSSGDTTNVYAQWRINYDSATGNYTIQNVGMAQWGDYYICAPSATEGTDLEVRGSGSGYHNQWELRRVAIQDYSEAWRLENGTYRVQNVYGTCWQAITTATAEPHPKGSNTWDYTGYDGLGYNADKVTDGTQLFQFDWTSGGYVTFFDNKSGRYIGDRSGATTALDVAISELVDSPNNSFDDRLRFYWIPIPVYSTYVAGSDDGITRQEDAYYLCNVLTGKCLYISVATGTVRTDKITHTAWYFTPLTADEIYKENPNQGYNGDTGVYLDSMDETNTIRMPIKIYDYLNDGMLFEYAQNKDSGTASIDIGGSVLEKYNSSGSSTTKIFQMGNNTGFTFQSGSRGGAWVTYNSNGYPAGKNDPGVWNTYKTFLMGKVWTMQNKGGVPTSGWYTVDGTGGIFENSSVDYSWEAYGLGAFRNASYNNLLDKDTASVYYISGINDEVKQGINKTTYYPSGGNYGELNVELQSGTTTVTSNSITYSGDPYKLYGYVSGHATIGLIQPTLNSVTNAPEYRDVTIEYLAYMLKETLEIPQTDPDGSGNWAYNYVLGTTHDRYSYTRADGTVVERDLAAWLRSRMTGTKNNGFNYNGTLKYDYIGSYADTMYKLNPANGIKDLNGNPYKLIGTWDECKQSINTYCDAAYYLLNNLFVADSYNESQDMFDYLELTSVKVDDDQGNIVDAFVFDSGFTTGGTTASGSETAVYYDTVNKVIKNTAVTGKASAFYDDKGSYACAHPFLPVWEDDFDMATQTGSQEMTVSPYLKDDGVTNTDANDPNTYVNRNYNYVIASNGEFQYSYDDQLFFNFEGDDDVYLFINGQLVLDIGGAHAITSFEINLNDYVNAAWEKVNNDPQNATARDYALALRDGEVYSFDFYYMERHGWGSNMRIVTNIRVVEKGMLAEKDGAQFETDLDTNEIVNANEPVAYDFTLTNSGTANLIHPTFTDSDIGVTISWDKGLVVAEGVNKVTVFDKNGDTLDAGDLIITYTNPMTGNTTTRTFADNEELKAYLTDELVIETKGQSMGPYGTVSVSGIYYKLTQAQIQAGVFRNTVVVTAYMRNDAASTTAENVTVGDPVTIQQTTSEDITDATPVENDFVFTNTGTTNQIRPTFNDADGGISISPESGLQVTTASSTVDKDGGALDITDLVFIYTDPNGGVTERTFTSNEELQEYLKNELVIEPNGTLTVEGIYYTPTAEQITAGKYENTVDVTTYYRDETNSVNPSNVPTDNEALKDEADFTVYVPTRPLYYHWRDHELVITKDVLRQDVYVAANDPDTPLSNLVEHTITAINTVALSGNQVTVLQPGEITVDASGNITADFQTVGVKLIYLDISYYYTFGGVTRTATATIPVQIFVLDVQSYTYVLDYGLRVELTYKELFDEDTYTVAGRETVFEILGITNEDNVPSYGNNSVNGFNKLTGNGNPAWGILAGDTDYQGNININAAGTATDDVEIDPVNSETNIFMTYTPKEFMDQRDTIYIAFRVREASYTGTAVLGDTGNTDIRNEAVMFKEVTFLPANVVYYEDDFAGVTYKTDKDTFTPTSEHNQAQSSDQNEQYGHDHVYAGSTDVTMSGGIITTITLGENQDKTLEAATFTFNGTGFEMISRTNAADSAIIQVMVTGVFEAGGTSTTKYYPIITEFDQVTTTGTDQTAETDEVYQVPVFRLTDLPYGEFTVTISGIPTYEFDADFNPYIKPTKLYIDGIRIYNPLEDPTASEYGDELGAQFTELRTLVFDSKAAAIGLTYQENTTDTPVLSGTFGQHGSFTENLNKGWFEDTSGNLQQFAIAGPNNEVYMDAAGGNAVVLFVKETAANTQGLLHIGVHDLDESDFAGGTGTNGASAIRYWTEEGWVDITVGTSGTEQYYPIDYRSCPKVDENSDYYYVVIQVDSGMVSFTNVKTVGLEFGKLEKTTENVRYKYENGVLLQAPMNEDTWTEVSCPLVTQLLSLKSVLRSTTNAGQPDEEQPEQGQSDEEQPGGDHTGSDEPIEENPDTGDIDLLWAVALIGLLGLAAIVPMIRKEVRA